VASVISGLCAVGYLTSLQSIQEKEIVSWKKRMDACKKLAEELEAESIEWKTRAEGEKKRVHEVCAVCLFHASISGKNSPYI